MDYFKNLKKKGEIEIFKGSYDVHSSMEILWGAIINEHLYGKKFVYDKQRNTICFENSKYYKKQMQKNNKISGNELYEYLKENYKNGSTQFSGVLEKLKKIYK